VTLTQKRDRYREEESKANYDDVDTDIKLLLSEE